MISGIIFLGTRLYMQEISKESINSRCTALVVLNTRMVGGDYKSIKEMLNPKTKMPWGNRFSFLHVALPKLAEFSNPTDFVFHAHNIIKKKRRSFAVYLNGMLLHTVKKLRGPEVTTTSYQCLSPILFQFCFIFQFFFIFFYFLGSG